MKKISIIFIVIALVICSIIPSNGLRKDGKKWKEFLLGDCDSNEYVSINDVTLLQQYLALIKTESDLDLSVCDMNFDGKVNINDATEIQLLLLGRHHTVYSEEDIIEADENADDTSDYESIGFDVELSGSLSAHDPIHTLNHGTALITSEKGYALFFGSYCECFDEEYFRDNALIVFSKHYGSIPNVGFNIWFNDISVKDNTLCVSLKRLIVLADEYSVSPMEVDFVIAAKVNKKDISDIDNLKVN